MKRSLFLLASVLLCLTIIAAPARRYPKTYHQPDGSTITLHLEGDERCSLSFTEDHIPVAQAADGSFRYITAITGGRQILSVIKAHDAGQRTKAERSVIESIDWNSINGYSTETQFVRYERTREPNVYRVAAPGDYSINRFPVTGSTRGLLLLVEFPDKRFVLDSLECNSHFDEMLNKEGYKDTYPLWGSTLEGAIGSASDYFRAQSYGAFTPSFQVLGPIMADNDYAYYGKNDAAGYDDSGTRKLVAEICKKVYKSGLTDFTEFDSDRNGIVDFVFVIYAGNAENYQGSDPNTIWPHQSSISQQFGNMRVTDYACSSELFYDTDSIIDGIGTICHEFSHILGLPDFYQTDGGTAFTMDAWSLMDYGAYDNNGFAPCGMTAFERFSIGWMNLTEISAPGDYRLPDLDKQGFAYRLSSDDPTQFIVLENHQQNGWFSYQRAAGLMATAVFYKKEAWADNTVNNVGSLKRYYILPADNDCSSETLYGDLFPYLDNDSICLTSEPASIINKGQAINHPIKKIASCNDGTVSFIIPGNDVADGVAQAMTGQSVIRRHGRQITVTGCSPGAIIQIYQLSGSLCGSFKADEGGNCSFEAPSPGLLLIRMPDRTVKI